MYNTINWFLTKGLVNKTVINKQENKVDTIDGEIIKNDKDEL